MVRLGVMSDLAIKSAFPEFQAPNVGLASAMDMIVLQKHELSGMRLPKDFIRKKISRFPINDIANFSSLSNVDNVSKTVYASTQGYRKKLGSSNIDREDRQSTGKFKLNERMNPMKFSENFELKRRGGYVDVIDAKSLITDEQLVANLKQVNQQNVTSMNKQVRNSQIGLAKVESNMNSAVLSNLENAKVNSRMQNDLLNENKIIRQTKEFRDMYGGEVFYNALTKKEYLERIEPGALREGEEARNVKFNLNIDGIQIDRMKKEILEAAGVSSAKEYEILRGEKLPTRYTRTNEEYIFNKSPFILSKKEKQTHATIEERDAYEATLLDEPMSKVSRKDPIFKDLPTKIDEGDINYDLPEYIRQREEAKLSDTDYKKENEKIEKSIQKLKKQEGKIMDKKTMPPSLYKEKYRSEQIEFEPTEYHKTKEGLKVADNKIMSDFSSKLTDARKDLEKKYIPILEREQNIRQITNEYETLYEHNLNLAMEEHLPPPHLIPVPNYLPQILPYPDYSHINFIDDMD